MILDLERTQDYDEPQYYQNTEYQSQDDGNYRELFPIYSPKQIYLLKKSSVLEDQDDFMLDQYPPNCRLLKRSSLEKDDSSTESNNYALIENQCNREFQKVYIPKDYPVPPIHQVQQHLYNLGVPLSDLQEEFLQPFVKSDDLIRIKLGVDQELLQDRETRKFLNWIDAICEKKRDSFKEAQRKLKVKKYLTKKHARTYEKKVHYHIRQKVAEERLRIKGRFVTWNQALNMLNENKVTKQQKWAYQDYLHIKQLLNQQYGDKQ